MLQEYRTFKLLPPGSMSYGDVAWCPAAHEPDAAELVPFHPGVNVLMVLGAQKAGTTWLFNAMTQHPSVHGAEVGYMCAASPLHGFCMTAPVPYAWSPCMTISGDPWTAAVVCIGWPHEVCPSRAHICHVHVPHACRRGSDWSKEIHYFDRWPLVPKRLWQYADTFPPPKVRKAIKRAEYLLDKAGVSVEHNSRERVLAAAAGLDHRSVFIDASPEYLMHPGAPPRIKQVLPLARFVIVLRVRPPSARPPAWICLSDTLGPQ